ncbi:ABC transporter permease [Dactylosporangium sp. NPDC000244]|uniref:ABC transporter permease n=1 Tax=Dactylosporangium sp. NPDC000244 TaxID=3154365 RepID=UPI00331772BB|nr:ABC transporter permease [Dactylosporangium thailandense]
MIAFLVRRLLVSAVVLVGISVLLFVLLQLMPGDPAEMMIDPMSFSGDRDAAVALRRHELGLDASLPVQYFHWVAELLRGNLGFSFSSGQPVTQVMAERLGPTVSLMGTALLISLLAGIPMGIVAALRRNSAVDYGTTVVSLLAISVPSFFGALLGIYVFGLKLGWVPTSGMNSIGGGGFLDSLHHLVLPACILGFALAGPYVRYARAGMLEVLGQDFLTTARSKGLTRRRVIGRHALHNALIPLVTVVAIQIPTLFAGAVVVEQIFAWPGMGRMALDAVLARDYPILLGFVMAVAVLVLLCNLLADVAYALIDPRIRL